MEERFRKLALSVAVACGLTVAACGSPGGPSQSSTPPLTQAQMASLEAAYATVENGLAPKILPQVFSEGTDADAASLPVNVSQFCTDSGTANATGPVTAVSNSGTKGTVGANLVLTFSKCTSGGVVLDGTLSGVGQLTIDTSTANIVVNPVTFTISGTSGFTLNGITGTTTFACSNSLMVDLNAKTQSGIASTGNATLQYPTGQNSTTVPCSGFSSGFNASLFAGLEQAIRLMRPSQFGKTPHLPS
jgi:hypothetical protein